VAPAAVAVPPLQPSVPVKIGVFGTVSDAGFYIALERGYAAEEGIDLELVPFGSSPQLLAPLATGQIDVGVGAANPGFHNAISRGIAMRIVADRGSAVPGNRASAVLVRQPLWDAGFRELADVRGRTVALQARGISAEIDLARLLDSAGLTGSEVNVVELSYVDQVPALSNGAIDLSFTIEPYVTQAERTGVASLWLPTGDIYPYQQVAVVSYSPQFPAAQAEAARRLMVAYVRGLRAYNDAFEKNRDRATIVGVLAKHSAVKDPAVFDQIAPTPLNPDGYVNAQSLRDDLAWFAAHGYVASPPDLDRVIDNQFVDYAIARLGPYAR
jgi:NitT/TauT family transport system substrate-binding protein